MLGLAVASGCASTTTAKTPEPTPWDSAASWRGPAADAATMSAREPETPALRALRGKVPLIHLTQGPWSPERPTESAYELTLFDDGTLVYEGHRCVKLGGLVLVHLDATTVASVKELLADSCTDLDRSNDDEVCEDTNNLHLTCSNGRQLLSGSDHCRREEDAGKRIDGLAATLLDRVGVKPWLGDPPERQACDGGKDGKNGNDAKVDLAPHEIERFLVTPTIAAPRAVPAPPAVAGG